MYRMYRRKCIGEEKKVFCDKFSRMLENFFHIVENI